MEIIRLLTIPRFDILSGVECRVLKKADRRFMSSICVFRGGRYKI